VCVCVCLCVCVCVQTLIPFSSFCAPRLDAVDANFRPLFLALSFFPLEESVELSRLSIHLKPIVTRLKLKCKVCCGESVWLCCVVLPCDVSFILFC
jgi:hypothetical protein